MIELSALRTLFSFGGRRALWYCNINQEQKWNTTRAFPSVVDLQQLELVKQQEQQLFFLAAQEDTVLLHHTPDSDFLHYLQERGVELPHMFPAKELKSLTELNTERSMLVPYMMTEEVQTFASTVGILPYGATPDLVKRINNKFETRRLIESWGFKTTRGYFCQGLEHLQNCYYSLKKEGFSDVVVKIPFGSSGKGLQIVRNETDFERLCLFIKRRGSDVELLIEGWHPAEYSLNSQLLIDSNGVKLLHVSQQRIDEHGVYVGTNFTPFVEPALLNGYIAEMLHLGQCLKELGYLGIAGVDSILGKDGVLYPVIEINARFTQVTYLLPLFERLKPHYPVIESRYIRMESQVRLPFQEVEAWLKHEISQQIGCDFIIYQYAVSSTDEKTLYRVFVLFYGNKSSYVQDMIQRFEELNLTRLSKERLTPCP